MMINMFEDEEEWLYADDAEQELKNEKVSCASTSLEVTQSTSNEDPKPEFESDLEDFEEESDDDGIIVSIGINDVKSTSTHDTPNIKMNGVLLAAKAQSVPQLRKFIAEDFTEPDNIDGISIDNIAEKPWLQPGADIHDYFNFDFNENTWTAYCERQKRIRQNESGSGHLQLATSHCAIPVIKDKKNDIPAINPERPDSHGSLVLFPDMSKPPPILNPGQFKPKHVFNSGLKPSQEKPPNISSGPPIQRNSSSIRSNSNTRSTKSVQEKKNNFRKNDSKERDLTKRKERSREKHTKRYYEQREKSRSRSRRPRSRSLSSRDRYYGKNRTGRGYY